MGAVVVRDDALLLVRRGQPPERDRWSVPGGKVRFGEALASAVCRELAEETGLDGRCGRLLGWAERRSGSHHFVILDFAATVADDVEAVASSDAAAVAWVPLAEVAAWPLVSGLADFLRGAGVLPGASDLRGR